MPSNNDAGVAPPDSLCIEDFLRRCGLSGRRKKPADAGQKAPALALIDVRSPGEFRQGHMPGAVNLPLFSDEERAVVGTLYKRQGRNEAVFTGLGLVGPKMELLARKASEIAGPEQEVCLYCSRGGMRSRSMGWLFSQAGVRAHLLQGGYKTFRRHVLAFIEEICAADSLRLIALGGRTGSGKTEVLRLMASRGAQVIDLEGMARHRGSAFGGLPNTAQPTCEHFSNLLALALARCDQELPVWVEDESENIGTVNLPAPFYRKLRASALALLETPDSQRLERVLKDYGDMPRVEMGEALDRISKRLGGLEHKKARELLAAGDLRSLAALLLGYYDRAYDKQLHKRSPEAVVRAESPEQAAERLMAFESVLK